MADIPQPRNFAVIGAGIVGICCALQLQRDGHRVTVIDYQGPGEGTSRGNAAVLAGGACEPVAMPGIVRRVPEMLMDPLGPLAIRWGYLPTLTPWLLRFIAASKPERVEDISKALRELSVRCVGAFKPLTQAAGISDMVRDTGWLSVYKKEESFAEASRELDLQRRRGVKFDVLTGDQIRQM
ncbi:MAG TPA: FAD-dependent oxidoreductase, partial [Candidatus Polarisedimenticolia bacterium]|nr:FAD-dependent oxidoreductase [Candidatus Polarisedimenticolia bacterium]